MPQMPNTWLKECDTQRWTQTKQIIIYNTNLETNTNSSLELARELNVFAKTNITFEQGNIFMICKCLLGYGERYNRYTLEENSEGLSGQGAQANFKFVF